MVDTQKPRLVIVVSCYSLVSLAGPSYRQYVVDNPWKLETSQNTYKKEIHQPKCTKDLPCYDVTLNLVIDGICQFELVPKPDVVIEHYHRAGKGMKDIIADGIEAAEIMKEKTGLDFTGLPDMAFLNAQATTLNGTVLFTPSALNEACNYRLTTVQKGEEVQLINKPAIDAGWVLSFSQDTRVYGSINRVLPAGSFITAGSYGIAPCEKDDKNCKSILFPDDPQKHIFVKVFTREWMTPKNPGNFIEFNFDIEHPGWQNGVGRGIFYLPSADRPRADAVNFIRFQWPLEH